MTEHQQDISAASRALIETHFARQGVMNAWGARLSNLEPGSCEISLPMSGLVTQQHGYFHGGVIGTIADAAGGFAANTQLMPAKDCLTVEYKINIIAPGKGQLLLGRGSVIKNGRTLVIAHADIFVVNEGVEKLCAVMQQTLFVMPFVDPEATIDPEVTTARNP